MCACAQLFPSDDPLDRPDFDPVEYVNVMFPNEQSLGALEPFMAKVRVKLGQLDTEMAAHVRQQTYASHHGHQALLDAQVGSDWFVFFFNYFFILFTIFRRAWLSSLRG